MSNVDMVKGLTEFVVSSFLDKDNMIDVDCLLSDYFVFNVRGNSRSGKPDFILLINEKRKHMVEIRDSNLKVSVLNEVAIVSGSPLITCLSSGTLEERCIVFSGVAVFKHERWLLSQLSFLDI